MKKYILTTITILTFCSLLAQVPYAFSYQAVLRNNVGNPISIQNVGLRISLIKGFIDGETVYIETFLTTTSANGLINISIGQGTVIEGNFNAINWGESTYFIKIEMDANGGNSYVEYGVSQLLSVPYALHSKSAQNIKVLTSTEIVALNPDKGQTVYNSTENLYQIYNGEMWVSTPTSCWPQPTVANAGTNQTFTNEITSTTLFANTPVANHGNGLWEITSGIGGSFDDNTKPNAIFSGQGCTAYTLKWTISTVCSSSEDFIGVTFNHTPTFANAGSDQFFTDATTSTFLNANAPDEGIGSWSVESGAGGSFDDNSKPDAVFTGQTCNEYILKWTIATACSSSVDFVNISFNHAPTEANAGNDQIFSDVTTSTTLNANIPLEGTGNWSIESGSGGSFDDNSKPDAVFTGQACTVYILKWTISTACSSSYDNVSISFNHTPTVANAGSNQDFTDATTSTTLNANIPLEGTGNWSIESGIGGSFDDDSKPNAIFTGQSCTAYILKWTISTDCSSSSDEVNVSFNHTPTNAIAGLDQLFTDGRTSTSLDANLPEDGSGRWRVILGDGGNFDNDTNPNAVFTGQNNTYYYLLWEISTACNLSKDTVIVFFGINAPGNPLVDIEGNSYGTIWIGTQLWMAENLKTTKYNDGTDISTSNYAWYNNNISNKAIYGALYNFYPAIPSGTLCPVGWHVPTEDDWTTLINFVGGESVAGKILKEAGTLHWTSPNTGTNDFGFTALPGGEKDMMGTFYRLNICGTWYSSTLDSPFGGYPFSYSIYHNTNNVDKRVDYSHVMYSVRCVKD